MSSNVISFPSNPLRTVLHLCTTVCLSLVICLSEAPMQCFLFFLFHCFFPLPFSLSFTQLHLEAMAWVCHDNKFSTAKSVPHSRRAAGIQRTANADKGSWILLECVMGCLCWWLGLWEILYQVGKWIVLKQDYFQSKCKNYEAISSREWMMIFPKMSSH